MEVGGGAMRGFKIVHIIMSFILCLWIVGIGLLFLFPKLLGYMPYHVSTGSMEPAIHVGSLIYVKKVPPEAIFENSIVTFRLGDTVITHRVVSADKEKQTYRTKGDANEIEDGDIPYSKIIGKADKIVVPYVGKFVEWTQQGEKKQIILVVFIIIYLVVWILTDYLGKRKKQ